MAILKIRDKDGKVYEIPVLKGDRGEKPIKGMDYWTEEDRQEIQGYIVEELAKRSQLKPEFANDISECTDTNKLYVLPDGYLYAYMCTVTGVPEITYESGNGYWYADEWNPAGAFNAQDGVYGKRTNIIPVTPGDQLSYKGNSDQYVTGIAWLNAAQELLGEEYNNASSVAISVTAPENAAYVWFGSHEYSENVVLDVRWILCQASAKQYGWKNTGHTFASGDCEDGIADSLTGKKIVYDGDSICLGYHAEGGYPAMIAQMTGGMFENHAVGGARLSASDTVHSVVNNLQNLPMNGDLYCFEGGINDYWANTPLGELDPSDYTTELDTSTFAGALEYILRYAISTFVGKPICFVIVHKIQNTSNEKNENGKEFDDYVWMIRMACEKYSIPYYDAYKDSGLNGWNDAQNRAFLTGNGENAPDGTHPNKEGYKKYYVPQMLDLFRKLI